MAHVDKAIMAEAKVKDSRELTEESTSRTGESSDFLTAEESMSRTGESSGFFTAEEEATGTSSKDASGSVANGAASSSEYRTKRILGMMKRRSKYATDVEAKIEASKVHWTELMPINDAESHTKSRTEYSDAESGSAQGNWGVFRWLQQQCGRFIKGREQVRHNREVFRPMQQMPMYKTTFRDSNERISRLKLGKKIAEGGQAEIFALRPGRCYGFFEKLRWFGCFKACGHFEYCYKGESLYLKYSEHFVAKVMKGNLEQLATLWPDGYGIHFSWKSHYGRKTDYRYNFSCVHGAKLMKDGRFLFMLEKTRGDLGEIKKETNGTQRQSSSPFADERAFEIMHEITRGMRHLRLDGIFHRDLTASNVLIWPEIWASTNVDYNMLSKWKT